MTVNRFAKAAAKAATITLCTAFGAGPALAADDVSVRLNWVSGGTNLAWYLGIERGYFEDEGINLTVSDGRGSVVAAQLVAAGEDEFGMADAASLIQTAAKGAPIKAVMSLRNTSGFAVLFLADSGIETLQDLEGRRVALTAGDALTQQWPAVVSANDLDESKILLTYMDAAAKPVAVMAGQADAMLGNFVDQGVIMEQQGADVEWLRFSENGVNTVTMTLLTREDLIEENPDLVERFVRASVKTWTDYKNDPEAAVEAALKANPALKRDIVYGQAVGNIQLMDSPNTEGKMVGYSSPADWDATVLLLQELGVLESDRPASSYYTNEFLPTP